MSFTKIYQDKKLELEVHLKRVLSSLTTAPEPLIEAMGYSLVDHGGKRMRPILLLETYKMFGGVEPCEEIYNFAVAVECVHAYSLIHDDLPAMDNDDFRRGRPTNHKMFGEGMAILAGDALLNLAYELMLGVAKRAADPLKAIRAAEFFAKSMGARGLIAGQVIDIKAGDAITGDMLKYVFRHKTGDLVIAPCVAGAILAGAEKQEIEHMMEFADYFSYAFQIKDDILDFKDKEKRDVNTSFVKMYGNTRATQTLGDATQKAQKALTHLSKYDTSFFKQISMKFAVRKE